MGYETRGLTVWQPWATLLAKPVRYTRTGRPVYAKIYETRSWYTDYRGPIAIHAAAKDPRECLREIRSYAALQEVHAALQAILFPEDPAPELGKSLWTETERMIAMLPRRAVICVGELTDCVRITEELRAKQKTRELALGDWTPGRYAWKISRRQAIQPVTVNGAQGLWRWR